MDEKPLNIESFISKKKHGNLTQNFMHVKIDEVHRKSMNHNELSDVWKNLSVQSF